MFFRAIEDDLVGKIELAGHLVTWNSERIEKVTNPISTQRGSFCRFELCLEHLPLAGENRQGGDQVDLVSYYRRG